MDIPILKYVDILIGLSVVMLLVSTIVLAVTQLLLNLTFSRARHLQRGLRRLLAHVEPALLRDHAHYLSRLLVRHSLIGQQTMFSPLWRRLRTRGEPLPPLSPGSVIQREELAFLMIELAAGEGPLMDPVGDGETPEKVTAAQQALAEALGSTGVEDPAATLRAIRLKMVENERADPEQPATRWRAHAVIDCAPSDFVGKLHASFDATMARVTDGFTAESKLWVAAVALVIAAALQLDAFVLLKRLSIDDSYRAGYSALATAINDREESIQAANELSNQDRDRLLQQNRDRLADAQEALTLLGTPSVNLLPRQAGLPSTEQWPGVLFAWILLSLGAPFWFDALKNLLKLRSVLAKKDDKEREQRQETQPQQSRPAATPPAQTPAAVAGEAGDLSATGAVG